MKIRTLCSTLLRRMFMVIVANAENSLIFFIEKNKTN